MLKNLLLVIASILVALLIGEAMLRVLGHDPTFVNPLNAFHQGDPELGWAGVPNFSARFQKEDFDAKVSSNAWGFRKRKSPVKPVADARKISFIGDSFTWGWGVSNGEVVTDQLQTLLGPNYNVQNYGVNGYGNVQELILFRRLLDQGLAPDELFLMVFSNDFADTLDHKRNGRPYYQVKDGNITLENEDVKNPIGSWYKSLRRQSYVLTFLSYWANYYQALRDERELQAKVIQPKRSKVSLSDDSYAAMRHVLAQFQSLSAQHNIELHVVYVPDLRDYDDPTPYRQAIRHICESLGIDHIDLTPQFAESPTQYNFPNDEHWTAAGHALAAKILAQKIMGGASGKEPATAKP